MSTKPVLAGQKALVNLTGQFLCAREAVREFIHRGVVPPVSSAAGKIICMTRYPGFSTGG